MSITDWWIVGGVVAFVGLVMLVGWAIVSAGDDDK